VDTELCLWDSLVITASSRIIKSGNIVSGDVVPWSLKGPAIIRGATCSCVR
ncbi:2855_t:CDS:1, partial [Diversispora eburnea]